MKPSYSTRDLKALPSFSSVHSRVPSLTDSSFKSLTPPIYNSAVPRKNPSVVVSPKKQNDICYKRLTPLKNILLPDVFRIPVKKNTRQSSKVHAVNELPIMSNVGSLVL